MNFFNGDGPSRDAVIKETGQRLVAYDRIREMLVALIAECDKSKSPKVREVGNKIQTIINTHRTEHF